jgi:hypothetical protein
MTAKSISLKVNKMSEPVKGIKGLVGRKSSKDVKFLGESVKISKLTVDQVTEIQALAKAAEESKDENSGMELLKLVIRAAVEGGEELTDEDFGGFPMDELSRVSQDIMKFSGIGAEAAKSN